VEVYTKFDVHQGFVARDHDVTKIWRTLEESGMTVKATISSSDGLVRSFQDVKALATYENSRRAAITTLELSGVRRDPYAVAEITLGGYYSAPISVSIRDEETLVARTRMSLTDIFDGMKPWYSRIATVELFWVWLAIFAVSLFLFDMMHPSHTPAPQVSFKVALITLAVLIAGISCVGGFIWVVTLIRKHYFPVAAFAIGQGLDRHQHCEQVRWVVIVGSLVSIVASVVVSLFFAV
jgi:hypothetical protein